MGGRGLLLPLLLLPSALAVAEPCNAETDTESPQPEESWGYWGDQPSRWHLSSELSAGAPMIANVAFGYGKPHWIWGGLGAQALTTSEFGAVRGGLHLHLLLANLSLQLRRTFAYERRFPVIADAYDDPDLKETSRPSSHYTSLDGSLHGVIPVGPTVGIWLVYGELVLDVPAGAAVFSEFLRAVLNEPAGLQPQLGWYYRLFDDRLLIGPAVDLVLTPGRDPVLRVGGGAFYTFGDHLSVEVLGTLPVASPDPDFDVFLQSWGIARVKWKWATGEPEPGFF